MYVYKDPDGGFEKPRIHPFAAIRPGEVGCVDFKSDLSRITVVLEDFVGLDHVPAIQTFYQLLSWVNGPTSLIESCDCALRGPEPHEFPESELPLSVHGRLMLLWRELNANCDDRFNLLYNGVGRELSTIDPTLAKSQAAVGLSGSRAIYKELVSAKSLGADGCIHLEPGDPGGGYQLLIHFKAFGHSSDEAFAHLDRIFRNIDIACHRRFERLKA